MTDTPTDPITHGPATFLDWLRDHDGGGSVDELEKELRAVIERCRLTGKAGSVSYTIGVSAEGATILIEDRVTAKLPPLPHAGTYFPGRDGRLFDIDPPAQPRLPLSTQAEGLTETRDDAGDGDVSVSVNGSPYRSLRSVEAKLNAGELR